MELDHRPEFAERLKDAIPAATLIAMRPAPDGGPDEILVVERARTLAFAGGMIAFPGGRVEAQDHALASVHSGQLPPAEAAARIAALRETFEETGLLCGLRATPSPGELAQARHDLQEGQSFGALLSARGWEIDPSGLTGFARWCPPAGLAVIRRFDTRFYIVRAARDAQPVAPDLTENTAAFWSPAQMLLNEAKNGRLKFIGPTRANLMRIAMGHGFAEAKASAEAFPVREIMPVVRNEGSERWLGVPEGHGYPNVDLTID